MTFNLLVENSWTFLQCFWNTRFFYKQHFYKQRQAEIKQKPSNNLRLNLWQKCQNKQVQLY